MCAYDVADMVLGISISRSFTFLLVILPDLVGAVELPVRPLSNLGSRQFHEREVAQSELLQWARTHPESTTGEFLRQSREADDPEVRLRCHQILRVLVMDEYEGEGYMGIGLQDEISTVPGELKPRGLIRVTMVQEGTPAERAGIRNGDLIAGVDGNLWPEELFRQKILMMRPNTKINLRIVRGGELVTLQLKLGRRPLSVGNGFFNGPNVDPEAAERAAKEAYFRRWLDQRKLRK